MLSRRYVFQNQTQLAAELDESGAILKQFIYATKSNVPDYMIYKGTAYKIISDQVGTPKLVVNANTGKVVEMLAFDEFGAKNTEGCFLDLLSFLDKGSRDRFKKEGSLLPFGFAGGLRDEDTGLMHFGAREYDPETGRWTTKDPSLFNGGTSNLYEYAHSDPMSYVDNTGKIPVPAIAFGIGFGIGFGSGWAIQQQIKPNSTRSELLLAGLEGGFLTGTAAVFGAVEAIGVGTAALIEASGLSFAFLSGINNAAINVQDLNNGIKYIQGVNKTNNSSQAVCPKK